MTEPPTGITRLTVGGYKSIAREQSIEVRPLTILAGANSSGKSSMLQPLLLLKQTLDATYDPGALLLSGPNITFSSMREIIPSSSKKAAEHQIHIGIGFTADATLILELTWSPGKKPAVREMVIASPRQGITLRPGMTHDAILAASGPELRAELERALLALGSMYQMTNLPLGGAPQLQVVPRRCFLDIAILSEQNGIAQPLSLLPISYLVDPAIRGTIHLPGLRDMPSRTYPTTTAGPTFPGAFQQYVASVMAQWQERGQQEVLAQLGEQLAALGLTRRVEAAVLDETRIEIRVDRLPPGRAGRASDMVNIADVGVGVSQTLPVLVALLAAAPGQLVLVEQPEIHLHPRAQVALAEALAAAALRGVRVVVETHSSLLLLGVQALVAEGTLPRDLVKLHWFARDRDGMTVVTSANMDEAGAFQDWPEDFDSVELHAQHRYLSAAEARQSQAS